MNRPTRPPHLENLMHRTPVAWARLYGSRQYPDIMGLVRFFDTPLGTLVVTEISGLPMGERGKSPIFAYHIHSGGSCKGNDTDPFSDAGTHYNPDDAPHPYHAGDLPPLFGSDGHAFAATLTDRFSAAEVIGKTVIIHAMPDDFSTQPAGMAGEKIACGEIRGR